MNKVVVTGAGGKMGRVVVKAVAEDVEAELVGAIDLKPTEQDNLELKAKAGIGFTSDPALTIKETGADVLVDFTTGDSVMANAVAASESGANVIIGTTGLSSGDIDALEGLAEKTGKNILLAPNFAIGAVLMMKIAKTVSSFADRAEIIELHHDKKVDAPSGTAKLTAEMISSNLDTIPLPRDEDFKARGERVGDIPVHSVRLPGLVAHQEVIFGFTGQTLTIRHDSIDRVSFMPGVLLAIKRIGDFPGFTYGLDKYLGL